MDFEEWTRFGKLKRKEHISFKHLAYEHLGRLVSTACSEDGGTGRPWGQLGRASEGLDNLKGFRS